MAIAGATTRMSDPLRRDLLTGAVLGFVLILVTLAICYNGVRQVGAARDAQASLDHADRYLQGTMRGVGELILSEGASAQIKALQSNLRKTDEALKGLVRRLPDEASQAHYSQKIAPAWQSLSDMITPLAARRGINAGDNEIMAAYGKLLGTMEAFEADFTVIDQAITESIGRSTRRAYWTTASALAVVLVLFILLNVRILRRLRKGLGGDLSYAIASTQSIAGGDLSLEVKVDPKDTTSLLYALRTMKENLTRMVQDIRNGAETIRTAAAEVAAGNGSLSHRSEAQAATLEQTAASMEELTTTVRANTQNADNASTLAKETNQVAAHGGKVVGTVVATMNEIQQSARKISDITGVIDGIAFQTNILALNAAVEAARAGEQGRGFAVVASEVRSLAQRAADAAKQIKVLIGDSVKKVETGTHQAEDAGMAVSEIVASVQKVTANVDQISAASRQQADGIEQINRAVGQMDQGVQQNAAVVEQAAAAAASMQASADQLVHSVSVFKLSGAALAPAAAGVPARRTPHTAPPLAAPAQRRAQAGHRIAPPKPAAQAPRRTPPSDANDGEWKEF